MVTPNRLDLIAVLLSGLCFVHCLLPLIIASVFLGGLGFLQEETHFWFHVVVFVVALPLSVGAVLVNKKYRSSRVIVLLILGFALLLSAFLLHEEVHVMVTVAGTLLVALAHLINLRAYCRISATQGDSP